MQGEQKTADLQKNMMKLTHKTKWEGRERGMGWREWGGKGEEGETKKEKILVSNHFPVPDSTPT